MQLQSGEEGEKGKEDQESVDKGQEEEVEGGTSDNEDEDIWSQVSDIYQGDGADSIDEDSSTDAEHNSFIDESNNEDDEYNTDVEDDQDNTDNDDDEEDNNQGHTNSQETIPVIISQRRQASGQIEERRERELRPIETNNRIAASSELPTIAVTNFRSLGPRINNVKDDILSRDIDILIGSETWQKDSNQKLKDDIQELLEIYGIEYISCPRPNKKRGGGVAILVNTVRFSITKINILVPSKLEVVWGLLRPKVLSKNAIFKEYIFAGIYSPPNYKKNNALQTHLITTMHHLLTLHPQAAYCIAGDHNSLPLQQILDALPHCKQAVTKNTYKDKILDVLLWNMSQYFCVPYIAKAVDPDNILSHVPSDHDCAVAVPLAGAGPEARTREYSIKKNRPLPESGIRDMGLWLSDIQWEAVMRPDFSPGEQDQVLRSALQHKVNEIFPEKTVRISNQDVAFITSDLKKLQRYIKREYKSRGKSQKYIQLKRAYDEKF